MGEHRNIEGWDAFQAEMMRQTSEDYTPLASFIRCMYDAFIKEKFTPRQALELCRTALQTVLAK